MLNYFDVQRANFRQMTHLFFPYSQNTIINSECKRLFCRAECGDAHWRLYRLPVVTGEQSPRKVVGLFGPGSKIRRYTPVYQCSNDGARCLRGQWWLQAAVLLKLFEVFVLARFPHKKNTLKNLRSHQIYIKMQKYCTLIIFIFWWKLALWRRKPAQRIQQMAHAKLIRRPKG